MRAFPSHMRAFPSQTSAFSSQTSAFPSHMRAFPSHWSIAAVPILSANRSTAGQLLIGWLSESKHAIGGDSCFAHSCSCAQRTKLGQEQYFFISHARYSVTLVRLTGVQFRLRYTAALGSGAVDLQQLRNRWSVRYWIEWRHRSTPTLAHLLHIGAVCPSRPFSQETRTPKVATEFQIGLHGPGGC